MPQIPDLRQSQRLTKVGGAATRDTGIERLQGEALSQLGSGFAQGAKGLNRYATAKNNASKTLGLQEAKIDIEIAQNESIQEALSSDQLKGDGSNLQELGTSIYNNRLQDISARVENDEIKSMVGALGRRAGSIVGLKLGRQGEAMFAQNSTQRVQEIMNKQTSLLLESPSTFEERVEEFDLVLHATPSIDPKHIPAALGKFKKEAALSSIKGFLRQKDYVGAKKAFTEKYSGIFDTAQQEQLINKIDNQRLQDLSRLFNEDNVQAKHEKLLKDEAISEASAQYVNAFLGAGSPQEKEELQNKAAILELRGELPKGFSEKLNKPTTERLNRLSPQTEADFLVKIIDNKESPLDISKDVSRALVNDRLTPQAARSLLSTLEQKRVKEKSDPAFKERMAANKKALKDMFAPTLKLGAASPPEDVLRSNIAFKRYFDLVYVEGKDPDTAFGMVLDEHGRRIEFMESVPDMPSAIDQATEEGLNVAKILLKKQKDTGVISADEALRRLRLIKARSATLKIKKPDFNKNKRIR